MNINESNAEDVAKATRNRVTAAVVKPSRNGSESQEIAVVEHRREVTRGAFIVADALEQESQQRKLLGQFIARHMTDGTDYGVIPGTKNKTLLKPGAEKLTQLFRCIPRFMIEEKVENWDTGLFHYRFSCQIVTQDDGTVVAEGVGSCSTYEGRYRWRNADRKCPECGAAAIVKSKYPPRDNPEAPGWYCFAKKGGCGANFDYDDDGITKQPLGRAQNPDLLDQVNTVLKMAKKRALVDAAISLARCSDIFTQDVEDVVPNQSHDHPHEDTNPPQYHAKTPPPKQPADPKADTLRRELKRTGWGWALCMGQLNTMYPDRETAYSEATRFGDIESDALDALLTHLKMQPDGVAL